MSAVLHSVVGRRSPHRKAINKKYYEANKDARLLKNAISSILAGRRPWASTLKRFGLGEREVNRIRSLDARYRTIMEDKHGVILESLYKNKTPLPEMRLPDVQVIEPVPPPKYDYKHGLEEVPAKGTNTPISWAQINTFWSGDVNVHQMGSSAARMIMKDGVLVNSKYNEATKKSNRATFEQFRVHFGQKLDDNAIPFPQEGGRHQGIPPENIPEDCNPTRGGRHRPGLERRGRRKARRRR
jgi:hypothetical protein